MVYEGGNIAWRISELGWDFCQTSFFCKTFLAPAPKSTCEVLKEADTDVQVLPNYSTPQKTDSYFNPKMKLNR